MNFIPILPSPLVDLVLSNSSVHAKRQLRKRMALASINIENEDQINANVDREINSLSIKIYFSINFQMINRKILFYLKNRIPNGTT
jgi:hypothetical protein